MMSWIMILYMWAMVITDMVHLLFKFVYLGILSIWSVFNPGPLKSVLGEVVLITGAGHGIGRELALQFARIGAKVVCWDINMEWNTATVNDIEREGGISYGYTCDISSREEIKSVSEKVRKEVGDIGILVNNAGIMPCKRLLKHSPEEIEKIFKINVLSHFWLIHEWLPTFMEADQGHIVALSSIAGLVGGPNIVPYCSTKFAVTGLMEALNEELRYGVQESNIKLTRVHPFVIDTGLAHKPRIRFPRLTPVTSPEKCAELIIEAMRRNEEVLCVPPKDYYCHMLVRMLPRKFQHALRDFLDTGVDEHDQ